MAGTNTGRGKFFHTRPHSLLGLPTLPDNAYRVIPRDKAARSWRWPPIPSSSEVKERVELYLNSTSQPSWPVPRVKFTLYNSNVHCVRPKFSYRVTLYFHSKSMSGLIELSDYLYLTYLTIMDNVSRHTNTGPTPQSVSVHLPYTIVWNI